MNTWRWDEIDEVKGLWRTVCGNKDCGWSDDVCHEYQDDCDVSKCPECGSENVIDKEEEIES